MIVTLPENERAAYRVVQCKQKFGTLRCYMSKETEAMSERIGEAENESFHVCERCGGPEHEKPKCPTKR